MGGKNAAWAGALLFSPLGGDESWRLMSSNSDSFTGKDYQIDTMNDWRDVLYAKIAFDAAFKAGAAEFTKNLLLSEINPTGNASKQLITDAVILGKTNIAFLAAGELNDAFYNAWLGTSNPELLAAFKMIDELGKNAFLDMLMGAQLGDHITMPTTDETFADNSRAYFGSALPLDTTSLYELELDEIIALAKQKDSAGENTRAALSALSFVSVDVSDTVAAKNSLYSLDNPNGMTDVYIEKRAQMLEALFSSKQAQLDGARPAFLDLDSGIALNAGGLAQNAIIFGSDEDNSDLDVLRSNNGLGDDYIFGGGGDDTIRTGKGNDYLEGNQGNDTLIVEVM